MFKLSDVPAWPELHEFLSSLSRRGQYIERIVDPNFTEGSDRAHEWCSRYVDGLIHENRLPEPGNRNAWATAFYICMFTHGATADFARGLHERVYQAGGGRPDVEPCPKIESIIERTWGGVMHCNPAGSELPRLASETHDPLLIDRMANRGRPRVELIPGCSVQKRKIDWLWKGWIAGGKIQLIAGDPGTGKSTLLLALLAIMSRGGSWPDGTQAPQGDVLVWSSEDNIEDTLMPRFEAAGGDRRHISFVGPVYDPDATGEGETKRMFDPAHDLPRLLEAARGKPNLKAIMIDPVVVAVTGDSHKNAEVRRSLMPLYDFAEESGVAVIGITHFTKGSMGKDPASRVTGSLAFGALARIVMAAAKSEDGTRRILVRAKSNIGPDGDGVEYTLERNADEEQFVIWGEFRTGTARELLEEVSPKKDAGPPDTARANAMQWLRALLLEAGDRGLPTSGVFKRADVDGIAIATLKRARAKCMDIQTVTRPGRSPGGETYYVLVAPPTDVR